MRPWASRESIPSATVSLGVIVLFAVRLRRNVSRTGSTVRSERKSFSHHLQESFSRNFAIHFEPLIVTGNFAILVNDAVTALDINAVPEPKRRAFPQLCGRLWRYGEIGQFRKR